MKLSLQLKTIKESCDNPNCDFIRFYFNTTKVAIRFRRKILSRIPNADPDQCPHTYVKLSEVDI